ncbi:hypothetical protein JT318_gp58 [Pseudomonas phage PspYZU01]|uniref:Uncharacterized protein n=1 Tax=Pseudomonas phage PspYZU01 TaxID=1983555 RepID=A0A2U7N864_9CAUD|nr:hypothetical protein JT318_gp58 [Pseudomonas phage PspYZU01]ASD51943.1 hypothetical protein PspYZU01_58 [Pseudomonas phage PspYZU01]
MSQSIEQVIAANTAALVANTEATLTLIELFKAAGVLAGAKPSDKAPAKPSGKTNATPAPAAEQEEEEEEEADPDTVAGPQPDGSVHWADAASNKFGTFPTMAKFNAAKKKSKDIFVISKNLFDEKTADAEEAAAEAAAAAAAAKPAAKGKGKSEPAAATLDDMVAVFSKFISKDLDADVRKERHAFAKDLLGRLGAEKASAVAPEHYSLVIATLTSVMEGEEVDLDEVFADESDDEDGLI